MLEIRNRFNEVIHSGEFETVKELLEDGIKKGISFKYADLRYDDLEGIDLEGADLRGTDLRGSDLRGSDLRYANLEGADLSYADNYYSFFALDTSKRIVHCIKYEHTWMIKAGCFWGTLDELEKKVKESHNSRVYLANIELLKTL